MGLAFALIFMIIPLYFLGRLYFGQDGLIFQPGPMLDYSPNDLSIPFEDLRLACENGITVHAWWIPHLSSDQVVLFFHGTYGNITHEMPTIRFLHSLHVNILIVEYPGFEGNGQRPSESGCYMAGQAAWSYAVEKLSFSPENVILFGNSLGSAVATHLAIRKTCGGLVILNGFTSVPDLAARTYPYLPVRPFVHTKMNSLERMAKLTCPLIVVHSETDSWIPIIHGRRLYEKAAGSKTFITFRGSHIGWQWQSASCLRAALHQLLEHKVETWNGLARD